MKCTALVRLFYAACLILIACTGTSRADDTAPPATTSDNYPDCVECEWEDVFGEQEEYLDIELAGEILYNCISIVRVFDAKRSLNDAQILRVKFLAKDNKCETREFEIQDSIVLRISGLGTGPPRYYTVLPAAEWSRDSTIELRQNFLEVLGLLAYGGSDESQREVGFENMYFGAELMFGRYLWKNFALAGGGGFFSERSRMRFNLMGHARFRFNADEVVEVVRIEPGICQFIGINDTTPLPSPGLGFERYEARREVDPTVRFLHYSEEHLALPEWYAFAEGGITIDGDYEGAGAEPSLNPNDHGQWFMGGGMGVTIDWFSLQLAYRFSRLNVRTPCENCGDYFVVNTDEVNAVLLRAGWHLGL